MYRIRSIEPDDNAALATIITEVLASYGAVGDGYACADPEIQDMYGAYSRSGFGYYVLANADNIACGGGGFGALKDAPEGTCEIQKMYFLP
ncbi:MAG: GNAT family N-acetyltransferase, partial [Flavobacteriales bacterium]|nr:GNAT family N-acetyltransferase [Flavobacteriales bacterium]